MSMQKVISKLPLVLTLMALSILALLLREDWLLLLRQLPDNSGGYIYESNLAASDNSLPNDATLKPPPEYNAIIIPKISLESPIYEGTEDALEKGVWRKPFPANPEIGGNTVLTAHRFRYLSGQNTFYHLNKLQPGDTFLVFWNGKEYDYVVNEVFSVKPEESWIEEPTTEPTLTLYTCTRNAEMRIVVRAKPL